MAVLPSSGQLTPDAPSHRPTPVSAPMMIWVVLTEMPACVRGVDD
jgi:hypothetical protein